MRRALALLLPAVLALAAVPPEAVAEADAWVERAIARGLPDARDAVPHAGMLRVNVRVPVDDLRPLWEAWWPLELLSVDQPPARVMRLRLAGVHLRLADGTWLAGAERPVAAKAGVEIDATGVQPIGLAEAMAGLPAWSSASTAGCLHQFDARELHLWRLGAPGRSERMLATYISSPWQPLLQPRSLVTGDDVPTRWGECHLDADLSRFPLALLPRLLRDRAFIWFANRAADGSGLTRQAAATAALEFAPQGIHQALARHFAALAAAAEVPAWQPGGSLDDLLRAWNEGPPPDPGLLDLDALAALLADRRPSRWLESGLPRLVGDNALRGMALKLGRDPRLLAGLDPSEPWQDEARTLAAKTVQAWWRANRATPIPQLLRTALGGSSLAVQEQILRRLPEEQRPAVLAGIAAAWLADDPFVDPPPSPPQVFMVAGPGLEGRIRGQRYHIDHLLALAGRQTVLLDALDRLPERPATRLPRAIAHDLRGEPRQLDALLAAILAGAGDRSEACAVLAAVQHRPSPARLAAVRAALAAKAPRWSLAVGVLLLAYTQHASAQLPQDDRRAGLAMRLGLAVNTLEDRTVIAELVGTGALVYNRWLCGDAAEAYDQGFTGGLPGAPVVTPIPAADGLRLCDVVAYALHETARIAPELAPAGLDTAAPVAARDAAIAELRPRVAAASAAEWRRLFGDGL